MLNTHCLTDVYFNQRKIGKINLANHLKDKWCNRVWCVTWCLTRVTCAVCATVRPSAYRVHTTWIDKVSPSPLPHLITDLSLAHRGIHVTAHTESMRFVRHSCRFMSCGLGVHSALVCCHHLSRPSGLNCHLTVDEGGCVCVSVSASVYR